MTQEQLNNLMVLHVRAAFYITFHAALIYGGTGHKYGQTKGEDTGKLNHIVLSENPDPICLVLLSLTAMSPQ